jgi:hypothetical protein
VGWSRRGPAYLFPIPPPGDPLRLTWALPQVRSAGVPSALPQHPMAAFCAISTGTEIVLKGIRVIISGQRGQDLEALQLETWRIDLALISLHVVEISMGIVDRFGVVGCEVDALMTTGVPNLAAHTSGTASASHRNLLDSVQMS